ncbi:hypothetical protein [Streptomyces sp. OE57]|uniref:hypothetical protein n=1 Tax=Streptomyces lacaronensis TaxID=3379885 RepID=UPI0039B77B80
MVLYGGHTMLDFVGPHLAFASAAHPVRPPVGASTTASRCRASAEVVARFAQFAEAAFGERLDESIARAVSQVLERRAAPSDA